MSEGRASPGFYYAVFSFIEWFGLVAWDFSPGFQRDTKRLLRHNLRLFLAMTVYVCVASLALSAFGGFSNEVYFLHVSFLMQQ